MDIHENRTLGIDLGIASCGWAVIDQDEDGGGRIVAMGSRTWDAPETDKERTPTNQLRRTHRGMRRVIKRRRQRMSEIRRLFREHGLIEVQGPTGLRIAELDPWSLRAEGLDRKLNGHELAIALGHIAKHRGFKSNRKGEKGANASDDSSKMLKAINETKDRLAQYRTVGEMFARDETYADRKRNRDGEFTRSVLRGDQEREVRLLFDTQRRIGNTLASTELEAAFTEAAFFQRPLQDSEHLVGQCPFEPVEKRCAKRAPSFERFRLLSRLRALTLSEGREERHLTPDQIAIAEADFGLQKSFTFKRLRERLALADATAFGGVARADEGRDFVGRTSNAAEGTASLRSVIVDAAGESAWRSLQNAPERLDAIAATITFRDDTNSIRQGLAQIGLEPAVLAAIMNAVDDGRSLKAFSGAAHISAKAARAMLPHLRAGLTYDKAAAAAGYVHTDRAGPGKAEGTLHQRMVHDIKWVDANVSNPVARKAVIEAIKQVHAIVGAHGLPGAIHVELAREVGKSKEERDEIKSGIDKRNAAKDRLREQFKETCGVESSGAEDLLRFELWKEQGGRCLYSDELIAPDQIIASDNSVQVDHILPWSRSGDDSFVNKTLCLTTANQNKRGRTPFEWFGTNDPGRWEKYRGVIESNKAMKGRKKRNYLLKDASVLTEKFRPRNLNDTKYATRLVLDLLARLYPESDRFTGVPRKPEEARRKRRLFARPGPLTDRLRRAWGLQGLKKGEDGKRIADDRHHALDALIVAVTSEGRLNHLTQLVQERENAGLPRDFGFVDPPWLGFRDEAHARMHEVFVSRAERRRARGEGHAQTVRRVEDEVDAQVVYERKSVDSLTEADLERVKDPDRNAALIASLRQWIFDKKPKDRRPLSPKGDPIAKVRLRTTKKVDVLVRDGVAERGEMVRVDVFRKKNKREAWEYYLVPIYPHQVFDAEDWPNPPNKAIQANTDETLWPVIDGETEFMWSLYPLSYIEIVKPDGEVITGYSRGASRSTGALTVSPDASLQTMRPGIGTRTLREFRKFQVDRLGCRNEIEREKRTWRGAVCT
jgi:CRISPR-associated endonuclease Csn1